MRIMPPKGKVILIASTPIVSAVFVRMEVLINNKSTSLPDDATLKEVLENMQLLNKGGIAVAINNTVITKNAWSSKILDNGDQILIIQATQGG